MAQQPVYYPPPGPGYNPSAPLQNWNTQQVNVPAQNRQAAAMNQQTSSRASLPAGIDMSVLDGISPERLAKIGQLFQSGALQMFPTSAAAPMPQSNLPPPFPPPIPPGAPPPRPITASLSPHTEAEAGEVRQHQRGHAPSANRDFLRPPPSGPKNTAAKKQDPPPSHSSKPKPKQDRSNGDEDEEDDDEEYWTNETVADMFVLELVAAGYKFDDIAIEVRDPLLLIEMFERLNLPTTRSVSPDSPSTTSKAPAQQQVIKPKRFVPVKPPPVDDRDEYLAKLQAAKTKKPNTPAAASASAPVAKPAPVETTVSLKAAAQVEPPVSNAPSKTPLSASKVASMTELARKKLEALKAEQVAKQSHNITSSPVPKPVATSAVQQPTYTPSSTQNGLNTANTNISSGFLRDPPVPATPTRSTSGLPGLFMSSGSANASNRSVQSHIPQTLTANIGQQQSSEAPVRVGAPIHTPVPAGGTRKRAVAADFDDDTFTSQVVKRPFGQSRNASEDDSIIIQASDDEDEDEEMQDSQSAVQKKSLRDAGPLRDFTPKAHRPATPSGAATSDPISYEQKMQQIEEIKRRIAEKVKLQKSNGKATPTGPAIATSSGVTASVPPESFKQINDQAGSAGGTVLPGPQSAPTTPSTIATENLRTATSGTATPVDKKELRARLQKRLEELERANSFKMGSTNNTATAPHPALQSASAQPEPASSVEVLPIAAVIQSAMPATQQTTGPTQPAQDSEMEEGELSDHSSSNFYGEDVAPEGVKLALLSDEVTKSQDLAVGPQSDQNVTTDDSQGVASYDHSSIEAPMTANASQPVVIFDSQPQPHGTEMQLDSPGQGSEGDIESDGSLEDDVHNGENTEEGEIESEDDEDDEYSDENSDPEAMDEDNRVAYDPVEDVQLGDSRSGSSDDIESEDEDHPTRTRQTGLETDGPVDLDLAPELQLNDTQLPPSFDQAPTHSASFVPYRSPLQGFRDYRGNAADEGYPSLTYSHQIDPDQAFCPYETAGGKCNDPSCSFQHF